MTRTLAALSLLMASVASAQTEILLEDFEDAMITYTPSEPDNLSGIAGGDYFGRFDPSTPALPTGVNYANFQGSGFYAVQDTDSTSSGNIDFLTLDWTVDVSNFTNLNLSWFVAEDDASDGAEDWDTTTSFRIETRFEGAGSFTPIFAIESEFNDDGGTDIGPTTNELPRVDTNFDGIGNGAEITPTLTQFSSTIPDGMMLEIRAVFENIDTGDEDLLFDNLLLTGDPTVVPPVAVGAPPAGSTISLQAAFDDFSGLLPDAIQLSNSAGDDSDLSITNIGFGSNDLGIFGFTQDNLSIDLTINTALGAQQAPGTIVEGQLIIETNGGTLLYNLTATVPEPAGVGLIALALLGLAGARRRG